MSSSNNLFNDKMNKLDVVCKLAAAGNHLVLRAYLDENPVDLKALTSQGKTIFQYLTDISLGIDRNRQICHFDVINDLLLRGATPLEYKDLQYTRAFDVTGPGNCMAALLLMLGRPLNNDDIPKEYRDNQSLNCQRACQQTMDTVEHYIRIRHLPGELEANHVVPFSPGGPRIPK